MTAQDLADLADLMQSAKFITLTLPDDRRVTLGHDLQHAMVIALQTALADSEWKE